MTSILASIYESQLFDSITNSQIINRSGIDYISITRNGIARIYSPKTDTADNILKEFKKLLSSSEKDALRFLKSSCTPGSVSHKSFTVSQSKISDIPYRFPGSPHSSSSFMSPPTRDSQTQTPYSVDTIRRNFVAWNR